jgi:hypothetical protein
MLGRTRLYQRTGSPLIHGSSGIRRRPVWPWLLATVVLAVTAWAYSTYVGW